MRPRTAKCCTPERFSIRPVARISFEYSMPAFELDEKMLILQFLDAVETLDEKLAEGESLHVWLVIRDRAQFESAAGVFLDLLLQERSKMPMIRIRRSGVPILDRFAARLSQR